MKLDAKTFSYCPFCGRKLTFSKENGMFDGKGSSFCPNCGLINRKTIAKMLSSTKEWVPLEEAQNLEKIITQHQEVLLKIIDIAEENEAKVAEANKIVQQFDDSDISDLDPNTQLWIGNFIDSLKRTLSGNST